MHFDGWNNTNETLTQYLKAACVIYVVISTYYGNHFPPDKPEKGDLTYVVKIGLIFN